MTMRIAALVLICLALTGCADDPKPEKREIPTNPEFSVDTLFSHEGCTVYRFYDGKPVYYSNCQGSTHWTETQTHTICDQPKSQCRTEVRTVEHRMRTDRR